MQSPSTTWHTYRTAALRVSRSERTLRYWREWGMPMEWRIIDGQRTRVVREDVLLAHWRQHMKADPVQRLRVRAAALSASQT